MQDARLVRLGAALVSGAELLKIDSSALLSAQSGRFDFWGNPNKYGHLMLRKKEHAASLKNEKSQPKAKSRLNF